MAAEISIAAQGRRQSLRAQSLWAKDLLANVTTWCVWLYFGSVVAGLLLMRLGGDRWWFPTVLLFGPRWVFALPLGLLIPLSGLTRRRLPLPLFAAGAIVFGPIMGGCLPWGRLAAPAGPALRVLTCNVKGRCCDNRALEELIRAVAPDIVALQGCWGDVRVAWPAGWHAQQQGEFIIASRFELRQPDMAILHNPLTRWPHICLASCLVATPQHDFCFCTVHLQSPRDGIAKMLDRHTGLNPSASSTLEAEVETRWQQAEEAAHWLHECPKPLIVVGDFNTPPDSAIYRSFWSEYGNAFTSAGIGFGYTEWPEVRKVPFGIRIDHVLMTPTWRPRRCWVGPDVGSDHLPVIADLVEESR